MTVAVKRRRALIFICEIIGAIVLIVALVPPVRARAWKLVRPKADVVARMAAYGPAARERMRAGFERAGVRYPPRNATFVGLKRERRLEVYAAGEDGAPRFVGEYPILGASGGPGPKLRRGDGQVPEGLYRVESLNPNSLYHLALRVDYPSEDDRTDAREDGRTDLGGDIMIHGGAGSVGCVAMGDSAIEELFVLAADVGVEHVEIVLSPVDFRRVGAGVDASALPEWVKGRYERLQSRLRELAPP